ncbi:heavy metal-associated isoprenylated plant protein 3-like [Malania oleifera]|uniref:heavy metal-associated isoprenylated plant protein 3-like n=1 Tax=Malania oleifera TaxID=397392 RepID=UPI0025AE556C|nr:heavy metal-associated isoprenylated plant protein 3-like [Malania oleifera]
MCKLKKKRSKTKSSCPAAVQLQLVGNRTRGRLRWRWQWQWQYAGGEESILWWLLSLARRTKQGQRVWAHFHLALPPCIYPSSPPAGSPLTILSNFAAACEISTHFPSNCLSPPFAFTNPYPTTLSLSLSCHTSYSKNTDPIHTAETRISRSRSHAPRPQLLSAAISAPSPLRIRPSASFHRTRFPTMAKKKSKNGGQNTQGQGANKEAVPDAVVLKINFDCQGCIDKVLKCVKRFKGVESMTPEFEKNKLTVLGDVDPLKLREEIKQKTNKDAEIISSPPKKEKDNGGGGEKTADDKEDKKAEEKKAKEAQVDLKMKKRCACEGCKNGLHEIISKTRGNLALTMEPSKDLIALKGKMDAKALESLKEKLKKYVTIEPETKDGGGEKKGKGGSGDNKEIAKADENKKKEEEAPRAEGYRLEYLVPAPGYVYGYPIVPADHMFSDENPNAYCSVM